MHRVIGMAIWVDRTRSVRAWVIFRFLRPWKFLSGIASVGLMLSYLKGVARQLLLSVEKVQLKRLCVLLHV